MSITLSTETPEAPASPPPIGDNLFASRDFLCLWLVSITHNLGEKLFFVFLISLGDMANHSNSLVSAISLAFSAPAILFGSVAGVFVDRFSLRGLMVASSLARVLLVLTVPFAGINVVPLLLLAFGFSFLTRFFDPAFMKAVPTLVPPRHLMTANSVFMTTMVGALIGSFAIAGPIWNFATYRHAHFAVVALYAVAAIAAAFIRFPETKAAEGPKTSFWDEWRFAFSYLKSHPRLMRAYMMTMTLFGTIAAVNVIAKGFANTALKTTNPTDFTRILAFAGLGMVLGAVSLGRWGMRIPKPKLVRTGFVVASLAMITLSLLGLLAERGQVPVHEAWIAACVFATVLGTGAACIEIPVSTLVQEGVAEDVRGRIFGVQAMLMNLASSLPMAVAGPLADLWGPALVLGGLGVLMASMARLRLPEQTTNHD